MQKQFFILTCLLTSTPSFSMPPSRLKALFPKSKKYKSLETENRSERDQLIADATNRIMADLQTPGGTDRIIAMLQSAKTE
jgi:hypothetical protein